MLRSARDMSTAKNAQILSEHKQSLREDPIEQAQCQRYPISEANQ